MKLELVELKWELASATLTQPVHAHECETLASNTSEALRRTYLTIWLYFVTVQLNWKHGPTPMTLSRPVQSPECQEQQHGCRFEIATPLGKSKAACLSPCSLSNNSAKHPVCTQDWNLTSEYAQPTRADPFEIGWRQWRHLANLPLTWTPISTMPVLEWHRVFRAWLPTMLGAFAESEGAHCFLSWSLKIFFVSASSLRWSSSDCARMHCDNGTMTYVEVSGIWEPPSSVKRSPGLWTTRSLQSKSLGV